ncbi:hypothetical protein ATM97_02820 [Nocardia sp. MH4]|uniref:hypothetical protein n=1 Tax=Nocardia sp. MH4 TaxID=1768677 RepID=UPI001C4FEB8F|nr:hypothetical protein [Nocardia sp. MH4]MBW0270053.1 hypothetical protein [Nocardia sp. MH4]
MNAAKAAGLPLESSRPPSRAARREEAARLQAERDAADAAREAASATTPAAVPAATQPSTDPAPAAPTVAIPMKKRGDKRPFSTQLRAETTTRLAWLVEQGGVLTDTVDAAITAYLDAAGVPRPGPDGTMPKPD